MIILKKTEKEQLENLRKSNKNKKVYIKVTTILMLDQGFSEKDISTALGITVGTVTNYLKSYSLIGLDDYLKSNIVPYKGKLSEDELSKLSKELDSYLYTTAKEVRHYINDKFKISLSNSGILGILKRLKFSYKKTKNIPKKTDTEKQEAFAKTLTALNNSLKTNEKIFFLDAVHPQYNTRSSYGWIKKGKDFLVLTNSGRQRVNINGAINGNDVTEIYTMDSVRVNAQTTIQLFEKIAAKNKGNKVYLVCDNAGYYRAKILKAWITENENFEIIYLPPYSPHLNLIERVWKLLRKKVINYDYYEKYEDFKESVLGFFKDIKSYKNELETLITWKFQKFEFF